MRRREFLGLAGAGVAGALWRPKGVDVGVDSSWKRDFYGTDLDWSVNASFSSLVTVNNMNTALMWRRVAGIFYFVLYGNITSGTSFPSNAGWLFEFPSVFSNVSDTSIVLPNLVWCGSGKASVAAASDTTIGMTGLFGRPGYSWGGTPLAAPALALSALDFDAGSGNISSIFPASWASGDSFNLTGWVPCLDN